MQPRTRRQKEVLEIITRYIESNGHLPSYQMIAKHMGVSAKSGITRHINALEAQGLLRRRLDGGRFKLELCAHESIEANTRFVEWLSGTNSADGRENWEAEAFAVPKFVLGVYAEADICAFRVRDDAMAEKGICDGDIALVERRSFAREGSLVVASIKKRGTFLRRYYRNGANVELRAANADFEDVLIPADAAIVNGVFRALIRPA